MADQAIGILSDDVYDSNRLNLRALAYQAAGQNCAYLPDSMNAQGVQTYDKQNVRDGHYPIWGPIHFFTSNQPSMQVLSFLAYFSGAQVTPAILDGFIDAFLIPNCAMTVVHSQNEELSALASFQPEHSCECYYLSEAQPPPPPPDAGVPAATTPLPADCRVCATAADCPPSRPACNFGFCEVQ